MAQNPRGENIVLSILTWLLAISSIFFLKVNIKKKKETPPYQFLNARCVLASAVKQPVTAAITNCQHFSHSESLN